MDILIVLLFIVPGFVTEFLRESILPSSRVKPHNKTIYKILRGMAFNVPLTTFVWIVIWFWKVVLGFSHMIASLSEFWYKCITEPFILKYCLVLLLGIALFVLLFKIISICKKLKPPKCKQHC